MDHRLEITARGEEEPKPAGAPASGGRAPAFGVGYRRWVIVSTGLRRLMGGKFFKALLIIAWTFAGLLAAIGFLLSQSLAVNGMLDQFLGNFGPRGLALASSVRAIALLYPDVCWHTFFTAMFFLQSYAGVWLSLIALTALVPSLITRDRASHALTVYLSRPLTFVDYLLGKLGMIAGVLVLLWTGPLCFSWILSVLFSSDRDFFLYSLTPLLRALMFNGIGLVALASIAMGVSAVMRTNRATVFLWLAMWLVAAFVAAVPRMPVWMRRASFSHDLQEIRSQTFRLDQALQSAGETLPLTNRQFARTLTSAGDHSAADDFAGCLVGLAVLSGLSSLVYLRRIRAE
jgi:ABC-2 type transport system permease protein